MACKGKVLVSWTQVLQDSKSNWVWFTWWNKELIVLQHLRIKEQEFKSATNIELFHGKLKWSRGRCRYYPNSVASHQILMMGGDTSLNPGPLELKCKLNKNSRKPSCNTIHSITTKRRYRNSCLTRNPNSLNVVQHSKIPPQDNGLFQVCSLNARSLCNKSAALWTLWVTWKPICLQFVSHG